MNNYYSRIIELGNGQETNNIIVANYQRNDTLAFSGRNGDGGNNDLPLYTSAGLTGINEFKIEYSKTSSGYEAKLYKNGSLVNTVSRDSTKYFKNSIRTKNYLGKSSWSNDGWFNGKIYYVKVSLIDGTPLFWYEF